MLSTVVLAGCDPVTTLPETLIPLRNPTAPIASQADVTLSRMRGDWVVVSGAGMTAGDRLSISEGKIALNGVGLPFRIVGPGRILMGDEEIWVHWLDINNRTAALGNPDGARVWIMDRSGKPGERRKAAEKILDWYGYDLSRMK